MNIEIIVAIIGAAAVVISAIITGIFSLKNKESSNIKLKQKQSGRNNTQIGIQNNYGGPHNE